MRLFFKDLWNCYKVCDNFYRKHWKGYLVLEALIYVLWTAWFTKNDKQEEIESEE